ncbi:MAG: ATP-binding cassette domain-containing protein [Methanoregulaceae archaeon]|nr:ATP-binding cassette domain-containing protein [Methanoregulaceae archaeon]
MVQTHELVKHYPDSKGTIVKAVDGVSLVAQPGEIVGLLGANGAGKTTLLRMLSTVIQPTSGSASIHGYDVVKNPEDVRRSIGFMSSSTALYGRLTAKEVLEYFAGLYGLANAERKRRVDEVIDLMRINEFADRLCDKLSTGQKQRVSIARCILHDPPVLFFDEPTSGLDVIMGQEVMRFIEGTREQGKTVIYCTHIMSEVERLCSKVYVLHGGTIRGVGSVDEIKTLADEPTLERAFLRLAEVA